MRGAVVDWDLDDFERQIAIAVAAGMAEDEIATLIGVTPTEIAAVLDQLMNRLGLASKLELLLFVYGHYAPYRPAA